MKRLKKIDLVKFKKQLDTFEPKHDLFLLPILLLCTALGCDLDLVYFASVSYTFFLLEFVWVFCWFVTFVIYAILKKKQDKVDKGSKDE